jgi:hypothetical protein
MYWSLFPGPGGFLLVLVAGLFVVAWFLFVLVAVLNDAFRRRWRRATLRLVAIIAVLPLTFLAARSGDYFHLALLYPRYRQQIAATPNRPVRFDWGDQAVTVLDGMQQRTLVYDESGRTPASFAHRDSNGFFITTRHLIGNFFLEDTASQ